MATRKITRKYINRKLKFLSGKTVDKITVLPMIKGSKEYFLKIKFSDGITLQVDLSQGETSPAIWSLLGGKNIFIYHE